jgi:hypothetical protein
VSIHVPIGGEAITSAWGGSVANALNLPRSTQIKSTTSSVGANGGVGTDILVCNAGTAAYRYHLTVIGVLRAGQQSAGYSYFRIYRMYDNAEMFNALCDVPATYERAVTVIGNWDIAAGQEGGFKLSLIPSVNVWANAYCLWRIEGY